MLVKKIWFPLIGKQFIFRYIAMTVQANQVVISDGFLQVLVGSGFNLVSMWIVAHPAGEILAVFL